VFEVDCRLPTQAGAKLAAVDRVTPVVARPVGNMLDQLRSVSASNMGCFAIERSTDGIHYLQVGTFAGAPNVVYLATNTSQQDRIYGIYVIVHE
jgi:hypothetical protein